jgi:hypothetical protein
VEHVIPQSFGKFGSATPTLNNVCNDCNGYFKKELDEYLARDTYEGLSRYHNGLMSRQSNKQRGLEITFPDDPVLGDFALAHGWIDGTKNKIRYRPQVKFLKEGSKSFAFHKLQELGRLDLGKLGYSRTNLRMIATSDEEQAALIEALKGLGIEYDPRAMLPRGSPNAVGDVIAKIEGRFSERILRAFAKILMNFCAKYTNEDMYGKPWTAARDFIRFDGQPLRARVSDRAFWAFESRYKRLAAVGHNLRLSNIDEGVVGEIQMFNVALHRIMLAPNHRLSEEMAMRFVPKQEPAAEKEILRCLYRHDPIEISLERSSLNT